MVAALVYLSQQMHIRYIRGRKCRAHLHLRSCTHPPSALLLTTADEKLLPNACEEALDLSALSSPYRTKTGDFDTINATCNTGAGGNEKMFTYTLPAGKYIRIGFPDADFDSVHELRVGETCRGNMSAKVVECVDEPNGRAIVYYNDGDQDIVVTFLVEFYDQEYATSDLFGNFTLNWEITDSKPSSSCDLVLDLTDLTSPYEGRTSDQYDKVGVSCDAENGGSEQVFKYLLPAGYGITIGQTSIDTSLITVNNRWMKACIFVSFRKHVHVASFEHTANDVSPLVCVGT